MTSSLGLWPILSDIKESIRAADQKAAAFLTIAAVLIAFPAPSLLVRPSDEPISAAAALFAVLAAIFFMLSVGAALAVLFPRTTNRTDTSSLVFFGDIAAHGLAAYRDAVTAADEARLDSDLIAQIHINAQICSKKHALFKFAVVTLVCGMVCLAIAYVVVARSATATQEAMRTEASVTGGR